MDRFVIELESVDEAIVALGAVAAARKAGAVKPEGGRKPAVLSPEEVKEIVAKPGRKGRSDKGQAREPYGPRDTNAGGAPTGTQQPVTAEASALAASVDEAPPAPAAAPEKAPAEADKAQPSGPTPAPVAAPEASEAAVQKAIGDLFATDNGAQKCMDVLARFGVQKVRDLKPEQRAGIIQKVEAVLGGEAI